MSFTAASPRVRRRPRALLVSLALPLLIAAFSPAFAAPRPAAVVIGGRAVPFSVTPFVGEDGNVYAPADVVRLMGAAFSVDTRQRSVTVTGASGRQVTVPFIPLQGHECIALQKVAPVIGASLDWQPVTTTLTLRARLEMVRQNADSLSIFTSYPVSYRVQHIDNPSRLYVDIYGLDLAAAPADVPVTGQDGPGADVLRIRSGQINPNTVRITIDLKRDIPFTVAGAAETDRIRVALGTAGRSNPVAVAQAPPASAAPRSLPPLPIAAPGATLRPMPVRVAASPPTDAVIPPRDGVRITSVTVRPGDDGLTQIAVTATGQAKYRTETLNGPDRLAFDLAGASLDAAVNPALPGSGPIIKAVRSGILHTGVAEFGRVVVDLSRLVAYTISRQVAGDGNVTYLINLQSPHSPTSLPEPGSVIADSGPPNSLRGKVIVVDPGHGLQDSGAVGLDGSMEKNFTLSIGRKLRDVLVQDGATVFMTRADDSFLPVMARPQFAVSHGADYFISVHCDSSGNGRQQTSHSGTTVYFHAQNGLCRRMAIDIVNRVAEVSGLPADGVKSDTIRFQSGFGVLRGSPMPAVLVECGYMNNVADLAKLKEDATQEHIAEGIVAGLRDFIADRSAR